MSLFKKKKFKLDKPQEPRSMEEIKKSHAELSFRAGNAAYQVYVYERELENINNLLGRLNQEAADRNKLDAEAKAKEEPKKEEVK